MSSAAAIKATFSDFKLVRGRKVAQMIFELPLEQADAALSALGGLPRPDQETWVALARLDPKAIAAKPDEPVKERKRFAELPLPQQAGIRCADEDFWAFISGKSDTFGNVMSSDDAARLVREWCGVQSRSELSMPGAAARWRKLEDDYQLWRMGART